MWIKICGFKDLEGAQFAADSGVDAIGLNFYSKSPRYVDPDKAKLISKSLSGKVLSVGLFVNHSLDEVFQIVDQCELPAVQFHGDETPEFLNKVQTRHPELKIIKAWRMKEGNLLSLDNYLKQCQKLDVKLFACLIDAYSSEQYGGTGKTVPWASLGDKYSNKWPSLILAGGLKPENIKEAVNQVEPWGVDIASGVESAPGVKSKELISQLISQLR